MITSKSEGVEHPMPGEDEKLGEEEVEEEEDAHQDLQDDLARRGLSIAPRCLVVESQKAVEVCCTSITSHDVN